jgi:dTDP-4-dehydrorhamnose reductase
MKIIFTGGSGRFGSIFKKQSKFKNIFFPSKKEFNILNIKSINRYLSKHKPRILIHAAGLSRPMDIHEKNINLSINKNIIGTCNIVKVCKKLKIKLIYLSTAYVYPGVSGNYKESDSLLPYNNYAWSKLGGECAVRMYSNSLILRICMTERPFIHKYAFKDLITNFIFHDEVVKIFPKLIKEKGVLNLGGKTKSVYNFAKKYNKKVKSIKAKVLLGKNIPLKHSMNLKKLYKIIND